MWIKKGGGSHNKDYKYDISGAGSPQPLILASKMISSSPQTPHPGRNWIVVKDFDLSCPNRGT